MLMSCFTASMYTPVFGGSMLCMPVSCFFANNDEVALSDADDITEVAEHVVQHQLLLALV